MNEPKDEGGPGKESDFSEYASTRPPAVEERSRGGTFLRGCGIALGIAFLVFAFVVGACFMAF